MKISRSYFLIGLFTLISFTVFNACKNACKNVVCVNGECDKDTGLCVCDVGYDGDDCSAEVADKFVGSFDVNEVCDFSGQKPPYVSVVTKKNINTITVGSFANTGQGVDAQVDGNTFSFTVEVLGLGEVKGTGTISADYKTITIDYKLYVLSVEVDDCTMTLTRQ